MNEKESILAMKVSQLGLKPGEDDTVNIDDKKDEKELIISVKVIPNYEEIEKIHGKDLTEEQVYNIIWEKIKGVNKKLTSYKAIKNLEIKHDEFEKTTTMKIKRYAELKKDKN